MVLKALSLALALVSVAPFMEAQGEPPAPAASAQVVNSSAGAESQAVVAASSDDDGVGPSGADEQGRLTLLPHSDTARYWISAQANVISQWHPSFPAAYSGPNSLQPGAEDATSEVYTVYLGYELTPTTELFLDTEAAEGEGLSHTLGVAGFPNLDVVRNSALSSAPYLARLMIRQIIPLSSERVDAERDPLHLATSLPARRIEIRIGKFSLPDFFDQNSYGSDSHLQFLNWAIDDDGAYDYASNTRGYTDAILLEYDDRWWTVRFAEALMPKVANGIYLDANLARARSENLEFEVRGKRIAHRPGVVRLLSYLNHADMGNYEQAIADYRAGETPVPDIVSTRRQGRHKYGFGLNFEQEIAADVGIFGRLGWSDGRNESFAYTEVDRTGELGVFTKGNAWHRPNDRVGTAFVANGIVAAHQQYLALGGLGFILGDGGLTYGPEKIVESFYTAHLWQGFFASFDFQHINNPGYNKVRGPVIVPAVRLHVDF